MAQAAQYNNPTLLPALQPDCPAVLNAMCEMTRVDSTELMRRRFAENLAHLFPIASISFLTPDKNGRLNEPLRCQVPNAQQPSTLEWENRPRRGIVPTGALARCVSERRHQFPAHSQNIDYFPISDDTHLFEVIEIHRRTLDASCRDTLSRILAIYGNFVRILHQQELDALTGVYNRGAFDSQIAMVAQSVRQAKPGDEHWWLMMLDVDHFKQINDRYGHLIGDEVLLLIARVIRNTLRTLDRIYRYGGEEFAVLLSPCQAHNALALAERIRGKVESSHFPQVEHITLSVGLAPIDRFDHVANIVGRADQALYQAKRGGRNQVREYVARPTGPIGPGLQAPGALELFS
ncbi:MAG: GGDEF domain-containing protein [Oceanococcus sp.]|nr:MAG: GGDEF domain-containing protein [Oceanococcus sp.]